MICVIRHLSLRQGRNKKGQWAVREIRDGMEADAIWLETFKTEALAIAGIKKEALRRKETRYGWVID